MGERRDKDKDRRVKLNEAGDGGRASGRRKLK